MLSFSFSHLFFACHLLPPDDGDVGINQDAIASAERERERENLESTLGALRRVLGMCEPGRVWAVSNAGPHAS